MCMVASRINQQAFSFLLLFFPHIINKGLSERELSFFFSSFYPPHQQYLDINGKKERKKHNKQAQAAVFSSSSLFPLVIVWQIDCSRN